MSRDRVSRRSFLRTAGAVAVVGAMPGIGRAQGKEVFTMPKAIVLRGFVMNHIIHHRGQMTVYLRLQNVALPSIYGPSADEQM